MLMSKKFQGKTCAYCGKARASRTADHVFARELFYWKKGIISRVHFGERDTPGKVWNEVGAFINLSEINGSVAP
ncbi:MAG: hypothetical protein ACP5I8_09380 [Phycisphaerae bacterium]